MAPSAGIGFGALALVIQLAVYAAIGFVVWRFYQIVSKMGEDITAIKAAVQRGVPAGAPVAVPVTSVAAAVTDPAALDPALDPQFQLPPDHPLAKGPLQP